MKARLILSSVVCIFALAVFAQTNDKVAEIERKISDIESMPLKPDWVEFQLPEHDSFFFKRIAIKADEVRGKMEADMLAQQRAFQAGADYLGYHINVASLNASVKGNAEELYIDGQAEMKISARLVCEYQEAEKRGSTKIVTYWYLYEISKSGRIIAKFDTDFDCSSRTKSKARRDAILADLNGQIAQIKKAEATEEARIARRVNGKALAASMFIPGLGQMLKDRGGSGAGILVSELVLVGGGTTCYFMSKKQASIMTAKITAYSDFVAAQKKKNIYDIAMYSCYGVAGAVYIFNLCHAYLVKPTTWGTMRLSYYPALIPTNEYSTPNYALGAGVQIKF